jgi:hypothetical protein
MNGLVTGMEKRALRRRALRGKLSCGFVLMAAAGSIVFATGVPTYAQTTTPKTYYVGTCKPGKADYTTIQAAVNGVAAGSTINVCPGIYPEQVEIGQPLTLTGVQSGNNATVVVTVPSGGLIGFGSGSIQPSMPLIAVFDTGGPVNISGFTIDSGEAMNTVLEPVDILYVSSPGTIDHVLLLQPQSALNNYGVVVVDPTSTSPTVTIENSVIAMANGSSYGVAEYATTSSVNVSNSFFHGSGNVAILAQGTADTITGNTIDMTAGGGVGISTDSATVNGNTISNSSIGLNNLNVTGSPVATNNTLVNNATAYYSPGGGTFKGNMIVSTTTERGVNLACSSTAALSGNTFIGLGTALTNVPSGGTLQKNAGKYFAVTTIEQVCP